MESSLRVTNKIKGKSEKRPWFTHMKGRSNLLRRHQRDVIRPGNIVCDVESVPICRDWSQDYRHDPLPPAQSRPPTPLRRFSWFPRGVEKIWRGVKPFRPQRRWHHLVTRVTICNVSNWLEIFCVSLVTPRLIGANISYPSIFLDGLLHFWRTRGTHLYFFWITSSTWSATVPDGLWLWCSDRYFHDHKKDVTTTTIASNFKGCPRASSTICGDASAGCIQKMAFGAADQCVQRGHLRGSLIEMLAVILKRADDLTRLTLCDLLDRDNE